MNTNRMVFDFIRHLPKNAAKKDIERTYKALAVIYHPDKNPDRRAWAEEKLKQLNEAKELLLDPIKRQYYLDILEQKKRAATLSQKKNSLVNRENHALKAKLQEAQAVNGVLGLSLLLLGISLLGE